MNKAKKIFCIGFHKTGTSSLAAALQQLGYRATGPNFVQQATDRSSLLSMVLDIVPEFDAFQDNPWPLFYKELNQQFPSSRFILTTRPTQEWIASVVNYFGEQSTPMRRLIYGEGSPQGNEQLYVDIYEKHNREVFSFFRDKDNFISMDLTHGDGWDTVCSFLNKPIPDTPFPHKNIATYNGQD